MELSLTLQPERDLKTENYLRFFDFFADYLGMRSVCAETPS